MLILRKRNGIKLERQVTNTFIHNQMKPNENKEERKKSDLQNPFLICFCTFFLLFYLYSL